MHSMDESVVYSWSVTDPAAVSTASLPSGLLLHKIQSTHNKLQSHRLESGTHIVADCRECVSFVKERNVLAFNQRLRTRSTYVKDFRE